MIDNFAIDDSIAKVLYFHFGASLRYNLFDPGKDYRFGGHRAGSSRFLHDLCGEGKGYKR